MALIHRAVVALLSLASAGAASAFNYNEATDGDLSDNRLDPTKLLPIGVVNVLAMSSLTGDRDYFAFDVPDGWQLSSIRHLTYVSADDLSFIALQAGTQLTEPPTGTNPANLLGYVHFGAATTGTEIIDDLAASGSATPPAMGFTAPLPAGDYTFWAQQTGTAASYSFQFTLTPVPEPAPWLLMAAGLAAVATRRRRG